MATDRIENWKKFSQHMEEYIGTWTVEKYQVEDSDGCDLMAMTKDWRICVWNILRLATRLWNKHEKGNDLEKIAHYAEIAWTIINEKSAQAKANDGNEPEDPESELDDL